MDSDIMYAIDQIEENIVLAENIDTKEKIYIEKKKFPFPIHEGLLFSLKDNTPVLEQKKEEERRISLREKMERLKRHE